MGTLSFCRAGGMLVGLTRIFPPEPFDFLWPRSDMAIGCTRLRCWACGHPVRSRAGGAERLYSCACRRETETGERYLAEQWRCAGHPLFPIPGKLDGIDIDVDLDMEDLAEYALSQQLVAERPSAALWKKNWLTRLFNLIAHEPLAERLSRTVLASVEHANPVVRVEALEFFRRNPTAPGAERLIDVARRHPEWFVGTPNLFAGQVGLLDFLLQALAARIDEGDAEPLAFVREKVLEPGPRPGYVIGVLQRRDAEWLAAHAAHFQTKLN